MEQLFDKYKYYIGGSTISIIILYLIYNSYFKNIENEIIPKIEIKEDKNENEIIKSKISHEEFMLFMKTLKKELQNLTQSLVQFNAHHIKTHTKYKDFRDKLFTKDIIKKNIIIDSKTARERSPNNNIDTSNYTINLDKDLYSGAFKNVIGFRLIKAIVPHTSYTIEAGRNRIYISVNGINHIIELEPGDYTFTQLSNELKNALRRQTEIFFNVIADTNSLKYYITTSINNPFTFYWNNDNTSDDLNKIFGFYREDLNSSEDNDNERYFLESQTMVSQTKDYIDLVIPEIPEIACKTSSKTQVIDRIPFNSPSGSVVYYRTPEGELQTSNYFYPIKLSSLNIQLLYRNELYNSHNIDNYFEFELTIVKNTGLFK